MKTTPGLAPNAVPECPAQLAPAGTLRADGVTVEIGPAFTIAVALDKTPGTGGGLCLFPQVFKVDRRLFINWKFDWDVADAQEATVPNGLVSDDDGKTWRPQTVVMPPGRRFVTGKVELAAYGYGNSFEVPGAAGEYRVLTYRSLDNGRSWGPAEWTPVTYPDTRGVDIYDPPGGYQKNSANYKLGQQLPKPPAYMEEIFRQAGTRRRGYDGLAPLVTGPDGTIYSIAAAYYLPGGDRLGNHDFYDKLDWTRPALMMQTSGDQGHTWQFRAIVAFDQDHRITEFDDESCLVEPALALFPDGEMVCVMRTGSFKPLYLVRSRDHGRTWTVPQVLPIRGITPQLAVMHNNVLVLATGRPDCMLYVSLDRGATWPLSYRLFTVGDHGPGHLKYEQNSPDCYNGSTCNVCLTALSDDTLLYVHDMVRYDPHGANSWLKTHGHGRIIGRLISVRP